MPHLSLSTRETVITALLWFSGIVIPILCTLHVFGRRRQGTAWQHNLNQITSGKSGAVQVRANWFVR